MKEIKDILLDNILALRTVLEQNKESNDKIFVLHLKIQINLYFSFYLRHIIERGIK